jgi:hypothetical protein
MVRRMGSIIEAKLPALRRTKQSGTPHAFLRLNGEKMIDLNTLIATDSPCFLYQACSINSRGELTGLALEISTGELHAFLSEADTQAKPITRVLLLPNKEGAARTGKQC